MLETVRDFGTEQLDLSGEGPVIREFHARTYLQRAEQAYEQLVGEHYRQVLIGLDREKFNFREALHWAQIAGESEIGLQLAEHVSRYWGMRGLYREASQWLEYFLSTPAPVSTSVRSRAMRAAGWLARLQGSTEEAMQLQTESIAICRSIGDAEGLAASLQELGLAEMHREGYEIGEQILTEALALGRQAEAERGSDGWLVSLLCANLAQILVAAGRPMDAKPHAIEAVSRQRSTRFYWALGDTLRIVGDIASELGIRTEANLAYRESLALTRDHGDLRYLSNTLAGMAAEAVHARDPVRVITIYGAVDGLRRRIGSGTEPWQALRHEKALIAARAMLDHEEADVHWTYGATLTNDEIIRFALDDDSLERNTPGWVGDLPGLSRRESEVLEMIALGLSDREIADRMSISVRTVGGHVSNILGKLGVKSRTAAAGRFARASDTGDPPTT